MPSLGMFSLVLGIYSGSRSRTGAINQQLGRNVTTSLVNSGNTGKTLGDPIKGSPVFLPKRDLVFSASFKNQMLLMVSSKPFREPSIVSSDTQ